MKKNIARQLAARKRRIRKRLERARENRFARGCEAGNVIHARGVKYELADKVRGVAVGGVGMMVRLADEVGLVEAIDRRVQLLKLHAPYRESDHVINLALNTLCGGTCLQDLELRRNDEVFLDAVGADSIPDPTTAGDFCRRFTNESLDDLRQATDDARLNVWRRQPDDFFDEAIIVFGCNHRCDQENLIAQLAGGVRVLTAPVDNLISNGAYMLMTSLAWTLKSWAALWLPIEPARREEHTAERRTWLRMEFKTFLNGVMRIPCQIVKQARRTIYRVLSYTPQLPAFFRLCAVLNC